MYQYSELFLVKSTRHFDWGTLVVLEDVNLRESTICMAHGTNGNNAVTPPKVGMMMEISMEECEPEPLEEPAEAPGPGPDSNAEIEGGDAGEDG